MTNMDTRPVWFCDIDGVINRLSRIPTDSSPSQTNFHWNQDVANIRDSGLGIDGDPHIVWATEVVDFINQMSTRVEFVWLTSWGHMAEKTFVPLVGLNGGWTEGFQLVGRIPERHGFQAVFSQKLLTAEELTKPVKIPFTDTWSPALYSGRPIIWTDDHLSAMIAQKTEGSIENALVITPWSSQGLTQNDLNLIEEFVNQF